MYQCAFERLEIIGEVRRAAVRAAAGPPVTRRCAGRDRRGVSYIPRRRRKDNPRRAQPIWPRRWRAPLPLDQKSWSSPLSSRRLKAPGQLAAAATSPKMMMMMMMMMIAKVGARTPLGCCFRPYVASRCVGNIEYFTARGVKNLETSSEASRFA